MSVAIRMPVLEDFCIINAIERMSQEAFSLDAISWGPGTMCGHLELCDALAKDRGTDGCGECGTEGLSGGQ